MISTIQKNGRNEINKIPKLALILLAIAVPVLLIIVEPDYGTATAYIVSFLLMIFVAGIDRKYIITAFAVIIIVVPLIYNFVLPQHAKSRIDTFLHPESDPRGAGYNILQSKLAIGAGEITGMGVLKGNQTQLGYLYPKSTDFIFSVIGEEMGFVIACSVIILNIIIIVLKLFGNYFLNYYLIGTCEINTLRFCKIVEPISYVYAVIITVVFTMIVNIVTYFALKKIDMIESLKSVE